MAHAFVRASSQYYESTSPPITAYPYTLSAVYKTSLTGVDSNLVMFSVSPGSSTELQGIALQSAGYAVHYAGTGPKGAAYTAAAYSTTNHFQVTGVSASATSTLCYYNGTASADNTLSRAFGATIFNLGTRYYNGSRGDYANGEMSEIGIWDVALTGAEIVSLSKGFKPHRVRPQSLVYYAPLIRDVQDVRKALALTAYNSPTVATHPRVY